MKIVKNITVAALAVSFLAAPLLSFAEDAKTKPYPLMGKPYVFTHDGREIQLCCKSCLKDFNKEPAKYVKKIEEAEAKPKKS